MFGPEKRTNLACPFLSDTRIKAEVRSKLGEEKLDNSSISPCHTFKTLKSKNLLLRAPFLAFTKRERGKERKKVSIQQVTKAFQVVWKTPPCQSTKTCSRHERDKSNFR